MFSKFIIFSKKFFKTKVFDKVMDMFSKIRTSSYIVITSNLPVTLKLSKFKVVSILLGPLVTPTFVSSFSLSFSAFISLMLA